jgi:hypothetical protein
MALYEKPVRLLFKDMVSDLGVEPGEVITRDEVNDWFKANYPKVKYGTISAHLLKMSSNAPSRIHYSANPNGDDDLLFQIDSHRFRLFEPASDPAPIYERQIVGEEENEYVGSIERSKFAYESDLQSYLAKNLSLISPDLSLYEEEGISGIEFPVGSRRIDILAVDSNKEYLVIELKVSKGYDRVVGQLLRYISWIRKYHADPGQKVRGVIVAREISEDLLLACSELPNIELFEYELSISLRKTDKI